MLKGSRAIEYNHLWIACINLKENHLKALPSKHSGANTITASSLSGYVARHLSTACSHRSCRPEMGFVRGRTYVRWSFCTKARKYVASRRYRTNRRPEYHSHK